MPPAQDENFSLIYFYQTVNSHLICYKVFIFYSLCDKLNAYLF